MVTYGPPAKTISSIRRADAPPGGLVDVDAGACVVDSGTVMVDVAPCSAACVVVEEGSATVVEGVDGMVEVGVVAFPQPASNSASMINDRRLMASSVVRTATLDRRA